MRNIFFLLTVMLLVSCTKDEIYKDLTIHTYTQSSDEIDMLNRINHYRDSIGVQQVSLLEHVSYKCYEHNQYMIENNVVNHDYFCDRSTNIQNIYGAVHVGEIIAYNYTTNRSALVAWNNSPCHDTIIRSEFNRVGISITENPTNHRKYYTVIFID